ncbi:uncharacterized protein HGUI_00824 [Hanseniaspora guilliermondii]|uniref:Uncharacterized protein n=1 Tax=Hanseniaspora guilliermondii TaxID=56406 RepID=A0A1L0AX02_9ASCO|nr:uncharacterized protein HGUI_00824 [Hanseniaspora guilliermondii]
MGNMDYLPAFYMPLVLSSRYNIVLVTVMVSSLIYSVFFISSNFLPSTFTDDRKHIFIPNEQDYFRTCLLGIFSPMFFNIIKNILLKSPFKNSVLKVITHIFIESCLYDWFMFLIIFFLAYPQVESDSYINEHSDIKDSPRNVFHIIPKQCYILAICWSLSECIISVLENMSIYQEVVSPELVAIEELDIQEPLTLNILHSVYQKLIKLVDLLINKFILRILTFIACIFHQMFNGLSYIFSRKNTIHSDENEMDNNEKAKFQLLKQLDVSKCSEVFQKAMMRQKCMQYQTSEPLKNRAELTDYNHAFIEHKDDNDITLKHGANDKNLEEVVLINFKEDTMKFTKINQDDFNYGSIDKLTANNIDDNMKPNISSYNNSLVSSSGNPNSKISLNKKKKNQKVEFIMSVLKMQGKPRPGNLYTNKNIWQLKKEAETKKFVYLEQQQKEKLKKYNEKLIAFKQQRELLTKSQNFMDHNDFINGTNGSLQAIQSSQYSGIEQAEQNLNDELISIKNYFQQQFDEIKEAADYYNEKSKRFQAMLRAKKSSHNLSTQKDTGTRDSNSNEDNFFEIVYNFYRIDDVEIFFSELRNLVFILLSNITSLIGEVLIFSIYFIYVPGHNKLFTPCVNYFGDKSFVFFSLTVLLPYTLINFFLQFILFFWSKLRQEYYFTNRINEFELLWGIEDEIMNQINSNRHMQNLDVSVSNVNKQSGYDSNMFNGEYYNGQFDEYADRKNKAARSYNPFTWIKNLFSKNKRLTKHLLNNDYEYYYSVDTNKGRSFNGSDHISANRGRSSGGRSGNRVFDCFLNYDGLSGSKTGHDNGSSKSIHHLNSNDLSMGENAQQVDYYQAVINNLNPGIDPLSSGSNINNFSGLANDGNLGMVSADNGRRNMSILSTHELKMLNNASLISSNLTIKEVFLIIMYRVRQVVIKWRLLSENSTFMITLLTLFGITSFCLGISLTVTDIFLYFDHE